MFFAYLFISIRIYFWPHRGWILVYVTGPGGKHPSLAAWVAPLPARVRGIWGFSHPVTPRSMWGLGSEWHCYWQCSCIMWRFPVMIPAIVAALLHLSRSVSIRIFLPGMRIYSYLSVSIRSYSHLLWVRIYLYRCSYLFLSILGGLYLFVSIFRKIDIRINHI